MASRRRGRRAVAAAARRAGPHRFGFRQLRSRIAGHDRFPYVAVDLLMGLTAIRASTCCRVGWAGMLPGTWSA